MELEIPHIRAASASRITCGLKATLTGRKIELKPIDELDNSLLVEIQQIQEMVDSAGTDENCGSQAKQVQMVAGTKRHLNLTPDYGKVQLVAGVHPALNLLLNAYDITNSLKLAENARILEDSNRQCESQSHVSCGLKGSNDGLWS